jgi:hypothetical protein
MPYNSKKEIVFIDDEGIGVYEHAPYMHGTRKNNWFTCKGGNAYCCQVLGTAYKDRYMVVFYTILDCTPWEDRDGKTHQYDLKLLAAKFGSFDKLSVKKAEDGLAGCLYKARRYKNQMEPSIGSEHSFVKKVEDMEAMFQVAHYKGKLLSELWDEAERDEVALAKLEQIFALRTTDDGQLERIIPPFNYEAILEPPSEEELKVFLAGFSPKEEGSKNSTRSSQSSKKSFVEEDDIPF